MISTYYFDTSALLKKYFLENGTDPVKKILRSKNRLFTSTLTYAEAHAGFQQAYRQGKLSKISFNQILHDFEVDWLQFGKIDVVEDVCSLIPKLLEKAPLRGADSVHMASFVALIKRGLETTFVSSDKILLNAIEDFGGKWINPEET